MEKKILRAELREAARAMSPEYRQTASAALAAKVQQLPVWKRSHAVLMYMSLPMEPDTALLREAALREGKILLLPRCLSNRRMEAVPCSRDAEWMTGPWGIPCPAGPAFPDEPDLCLIPCVSAAPDGTRLGHGAGYYDRYLASLVTVRLCLCFSALVRPSLPSEATDIRMHGVMTENGLLQPNLFPELFGHSPENG